MFSQACVKNSVHRGGVVYTPPIRADPLPPSGQTPTQTPPKPRRSLQQTVHILLERILIFIVIRKTKWIAPLSILSVIHTVAIATKLNVNGSNKRRYAQTDLKSDQNLIIFNKANKFNKSNKSLSLLKYFFFFFSKKLNIGHLSEISYLWGCPWCQRWRVSEGCSGRRTRAPDSSAPRSACINNQGQQSRSMFIKSTKSLRGLFGKENTCTWFLNTTISLYKQSRSTIKVNNQIQ